MDASQFMPSGAWLSADDLKGRTVTLEIADVQAVEFDNDRGKQSKLGLTFKGKDKGILANKTNVKNLVEAFGTDTDKWIGKSITASPNQTSMGLGFALRGAAEFDDEVPF